MALDSRPVRVGRRGVQTLRTLGRRGAPTCRAGDLGGIASGGRLDHRDRDDHRRHRPRRAGPADPERLDPGLPHSARGRHRSLHRDCAFCRSRPRRCPASGGSLGQELMSIGDLWRWLVDPTNWQGSDGIPTRLGEQVHVSVESVAIGAAIALPVGVVLGHYGRFGNLAINVSNVGRAVPSFGIIVIAFLAFGLGDGPIVLALTALAIPPMVTNSYVALREVDPDIKEAARGMGYRELAQVLRVELPLAVPLIMAGVRTSAVQVVATATLAAVVAGGGFGRYIVDGLARSDYPRLVAGALLVAALALATELLLAGLQRLLLPPGIRLLSAPISHRVPTAKVA